MKIFENIKLKKHLHLLVDLLAIILCIYMSVNKSDFLKKYWYFFAFTFVLLVYASVLWYIDTSIYIKLKVKIKRMYYAFAIFVYFFLFNTIDPSVVKLIGNNSFKISEKIMFTLYYFVGIILIDNMIISCKNLNEFTFGKANVKFETVAESIQNQINVTDELLDKISAEHNSIQDIETFINERMEPELITAYKNEEYSIDIIKYLEEYLNRYCSFQEKNEISVSVLQNIEIQDSNKPRKIKNYYSLTESTFIETRLFNVSDKFYLCIPYESNLLLEDKIIIIIESVKGLIMAEQLIIKNLLSLFEYKLLIAMDSVENQCEGWN